jgi:hypothetical protein
MVKTVYALLHKNSLFDNRIKPEQLYIRSDFTKRTQRMRALDQAAVFGQCRASGERNAETAASSKNYVLGLVCSYIMA